MTEVVLGVDIGTSGCKVVAVGADGRVFRHSVMNYPLYSAREGWSEQDPEHWWAAVKAGIRDVLTDLHGKRVRGIGLSGQMHGLIALARSGQVLRHAILWNDQRAAHECDEITRELGGEDRLISLINNRILPGFTAGKVRWMRKHEPELYEQIAQVCLPKDFIRFRLTGVLATDVSDASGTGYFDPRTLRWVQEVAAASSVTPGMLPEIVHSTHQTGTLLESVALELGLPRNTPVFGGGGDAVIQTTSMGITRPGDVGVTLGTAGIVAAASRFCPTNTAARMQISAGNLHDTWHIMGVALAAAGAFQWFGETVAQCAETRNPNFSRLTELAATAPIGSGGLYFLPHLNGERAPHLAPGATASFLGLRRGHRAEHLARAVIEGAILNLRRILDDFHSLGLSCERIIASGGASQSELWLQVLADVCDREVVTFQGSAEGGAYGAALVAGLGLELWSDLDEVFAGIKEIARITPNTCGVQQYAEVYKTHAQLFDSLRPVQAILDSHPNGGR